MARRTAVLSRGRHTVEALYCFVQLVAAWRTPPFPCNAHLTPFCGFRYSLYKKPEFLSLFLRNPSSFFSALAVETLLPASGNRSNYSHDFFVDAPRSSRYIAYLRYATIFVLAEQVLLLCGGHQKVINVVGDGTKLLLNNRPAESGALRL